MLNKKLFYIVVMVAISFIALSTSNAQETKEDKPVMKMNTMTSDSTMMKDCMDKIASNNEMRKMMMNKMMDNTKGDENGMKEMCKTMMNNPEMHQTMMKMMKTMMGNDTMKDGKMNDGMKKNCNKDIDRKSTRLNSSHIPLSRMPSSA